MKTPSKNTPSTPSETPGGRVAKIRITANGTPAKNFTFAAGAVVPGVPLAHAEYLISQGKAVMVEVA